MSETTETVEAVKEPEKKRTIRRRGKKGGKLYFTSDTQKAIVAYQTCDSHKERTRLYLEEILPAFEKLVENLINIHKFSGLHDSYDDLKNDCITFLFESIRKFDGNRGTNAFSYFNIVAKNWLIIRTKQKSNRLKRNISIDDPDAITTRELKIVEDHSMIPAQDEIIDSRNFIIMLNEMLLTIRDSVKTQNELACINSIITIFENIDELDLLNKSALLLYLRELSGLTPKQLTATLHVLKKHYRRIKEERDD
jgi:hypothetical protein